MAHAIQMDRRLGKFKAASAGALGPSALARTHNFDGSDEVGAGAYGERRAGSATTSVPASASVL
jgi:hypothetical protein